MSKVRKKILYRRELYAAMALALPISSMAAVLPATGANGPAVTGGNVPVVQIVTPNGAGVSHNQFGQFDVGAQGVVLNNSGSATSSQLAGQIEGNANLAGGAAKVIITEVTGGSASQLNGALEIAGAKAALVVANPNGINANGASFINASRVTLATGIPQLDNTGKLDSIKVTKGVINISGKGLNTTGVDMADLFARSVALNAELKAKQLRVVTGSNKVTYNTNGNSIAYSRIAGEGDAPKLALDVSALGSMYMDAIRMIGSESGVGVNVAGTIKSGNANSLNMEAGGPINVSGSVQSASSINLSSRDGAIAIAKGGDITGEYGVNLHVATDVINEGTLKSINSFGNIVADARGAKSRFISSGTLSSGGKVTANQFAYKKVSGTISSGDAIGGVGVLHDDTGNTIVGNGSIGDGGDVDVPVEQPKPPVEEQKPVEQPKPPVEEQKPVEQPKPPVEEQKPVEQPKPPVEEQKPVEQPKPPVEQPKPVEDPKPIGEPEQPVQPPKPADEHVDVGQVLQSIFDELAQLQSQWGRPSYGYSPWGRPSFGYAAWNRPSYGYAPWSAPSYGYTPWMPTYFRPQPVFSPARPTAAYGFRPIRWRAY